MKCLITGFTAKQRGEGRPQVLTLMDGMEIALRHAGWTVERRKVDPHEDLSSFDLAVIGVYDYGSLTASIEKCRSSVAALKLPHVLAWDDWQSDKIWSGVRKGAGAMLRLNMFKNQPARMVNQQAVVDEYGTQLATLADRWAECVHACVCCAFSWGDHSILKAEHSFEDLLCWDPTPFVAGFYGFSSSEDASNKNKQWVCASLNDQSVWLNTLNATWPVLDRDKPYSGAKCWQSTEEEIFVEYRDNWGVLSPPYSHLLGSGWWRNRYVLAADAGSVLYADPRELRALKASWYFTPFGTIEDMSAEELDGLAREQKQELQSWCLSADESASQLAAWLQSRARLYA